MEWRTSSATAWGEFDARTFIEKFDLLVEHPGAIEKFRTLIFSLAFSGRLTSASTSESVRTRTISSISEEINPGFACSKAHQAEDGYVHLRTHNISTLGRLNFDLLIRVADSKIDSRKATLRKGDILFNNTNSQELVGKSAIVDQDYPYAFSNHITRIRLNNEADPQYVVHYLTSLRNSGYFAQICTRWINQAAVNTNALKQIEVPLPPLAEQKRIVAKVDELMGLCDRLEAEQAERQTRHATLTRAALARFADEPTVENLRWLFHESFFIGPAELRKTVSTLAVQGKLVPQDPNNKYSNEPYGELLDSNKTDSPQIAEPPFVLPTGWKWLRIENVFDVAGGIQKSPRRAPKGNSFPYLGVRNVYRGRLNLTDVKEFELEPGEIERRRLEAGDLLVIEGNGSINEIGRCARWNGEIKNCVHQNHVIRCRPVNKKLTDFVLLYLNSPSGIEVMQRLAITSSGLYSLSVGKIRKIEIPVPPLPEQKRIVAKVNQLMALIDELEQQLTESRAKSEQLMETVVAELVSQN